MRAVLEGKAKLRDSSRVRVWLDDANLPLSDRKELRFWSEEPEYRPSSELWENLRVKAGELRVFEYLLPDLALAPRDRVLELGAGHGWASALLKRHHPDCEVHASDVAPAALESCGKWEALFGSRIDACWAFQAHRTPFDDGEFDRVFTFAAFHHFTIGGRGREAMAEALRILKPGGRLVMLSEPCAPPWLHRWSNAKLNRLRHASTDVDEDVLVVPWVRRWAEEQGASLSIRFDTELRYRELSLGGALRNIAVRVLPLLGHLVPVGVHLTVEKPARASGLRRTP